MKITKELLISLNACQDQIKIFESVFPEGAELNTKNVKLAAVKNLNLLWLFENAKLSGVFICMYGSKHWCVNGKLHREDGPAIEYANGIKEWYVNGLLHRKDGPAIEEKDGTKEWYVNGKKVEK